MSDNTFTVEKLRRQPRTRNKREGTAGGAVRVTGGGNDYHTHTTLMQLTKISIGDAVLEWNEDSHALRISHRNGTDTASVVATGGVTAYTAKTLPDAEAAEQARNMTDTRITLLEQEISELKQQLHDLRP